MNAVYFIYVSVIWLVCWGVYYAFLRGETAFRWNRYYLLGSFVLGLSWPWWQTWLPSTPLAEVVAVVALEPISINLQTATPKLSPQWSIWTYLYGGYLLGCGLAAIRFMLQFAAVFRLILWNNRRWGQGVCQVSGPSLSAAGSWFCFLFLPTHDKLTLAPEIKTHELAHIQQGHSWDVLLLEMAGIFFWWNPLWYAYNHSLRQIHEYLADAAVLRHSSVRSYAHLLVRQATQQSNLSLVSTFYTSPLKQRIMMMTKQSPRSRTIWKYALVLPLLAFLVLTCAEVVDGAPVAETPNKALLESAAQDETIYTMVDQMPVFGDCAGLEGTELKVCSQSNLLEYIYTHVKYPEEAQKQELEGTTVTEIIISETGEVIEANTIVREVGPDPVLNAEALRVLETLPDLQPGIKDGKAVKVKMLIPVKFKLE